MSPTGSQNQKIENLQQHLIDQRRAHQPGWSARGDRLERDSGRSPPRAHGKTSIKRSAGCSPIIDAKLKQFREVERERPRPSVRVAIR